MMRKLKNVWPKLYTCPAGTKRDLARDDIGQSRFDPVFSNGEAMTTDDLEGCPDCDYRMSGECAGPVEYAPTGKRIPVTRERPGE